MKKGIPTTAVKQRLRHADKLRYMVINLGLQHLTLR